LPYGDERRLGVARAHATEPGVLLLDEPAAGLNEVESDELLALLRSLPEAFGCALLIVEHDMRLMTRLCPRLQVLDYGRTIGIGSPAEMRADRRVLEAYLGAEEAARDAEG
jgi:branched-chain amino acid transport system ATP-binding protein